MESYHPDLHSWIESVDKLIADKRPNLQFDHGTAVKPASARGVPTDSSQRSSWSQEPRTIYATALEVADGSTDPSFLVRMILYELDEYVEEQNVEMNDFGSNKAADYIIEHFV